MAWTDEEHNRAVELHNSGHTYKDIADILTNEFHHPFTFDSVRGRIRRERDKGNVTPSEPTYKEDTEIKEDGSHYSNKLLEMTSEQAKDTSFLLQAHGYDPDEWEVINAKSSIWNQHNKKDGTLTLYASKITVKPKQNKFDEQAIIKAIEKIPKIIIPKRIKQPLEQTHYMNIPLFDMHFGIADLEYYKETQERLLELLDRRFKDCLFIIGQDMFHNDDMRGRTSSGREIEKVNMEQAWEDAWLFYYPLIRQSIKNNDETHIYYSVGNHDESMAWSFVKTLQQKFSQAIFDTRFKERKVHMLGRNFVGMNHSDKKKMKNLSENFSTEFPHEWSKATTREVFTGHEHKEEQIVTVSDSGGLVLRRMPTGNKTDQWHDSMGYTTAHKRFKVFEYSETKVEREIYV